MVSNYGPTSITDSVSEQFLNGGVGSEPARLGLTTPQGQAQEAPQQGSTMSDQDMRSLLNGDMIPLLQQLLAQAVQEYASPAPKRSDYGNDDEGQGQYETDLFKWQQGAGDRLDGVIKIATQLNQAQKVGAGTIEMDDGTVITQDMINSSDPYVAAQAKTAFENRSRELFNSYNDLMNETGLNQFTVDLQGSQAENDKRYKEFSSKLDTFTASTDYDKLNLSRAADAINRELSGMQESRQRADLQTQAMLAAAPMATGGKTSFTGNDLGAASTTLARQAGIGGDIPLVNFPTSVQIDPASLMQQGDAALGVGQGPLPQVPGLISDPSMIPAPVNLVGGPAAPQFNNPVPYTTPQAQMAPQQLQPPTTDDRLGAMRAPIPLITPQQLAAMSPQLRALYGL